MDLLERYLQAVRFWLPTDRQDELLAEFAEDLHAQSEERAAELGRPLGEEELAAILVRAGHPLAVAGQCLPRQPWQDPVLSLVFVNVVKWTLLWVALPLTLLSQAPDFLQARNFWQAGLQALGALTQAALVTLGALTLAFVLFSEAWQGYATHQSTWDPRKLPALRPAHRQAALPRAQSAADLLFGLLFAFWWVKLPHYLPTAWQQGFPGSLWQQVHSDCFQPILALSLLGVAASAIALAQPQLVRFRQLSRVCVDGGTAWVLLRFMDQTQPPFQTLRATLAALRHLAPEPPVVNQLLDLSTALTLKAIALGCALSALVHLGKLAWGFRRR